MAKEAPGARFVRFLMSGAFNTAATYALYLLLLQVLSYRWSYTLAYASGIALAYTLNRLFVFRSHRGARSVIMLPLIYAGQYLFGLLIVWIWVDVIHLPAALAPLAALAVTIPFTYIFSRYAFTGR